MTKLFVIKRTQTCHLLCKRPGCYHSASKKHVRDRIFKLTPIHASAIIRFPEFTEFNESSAPYRKNSIARAPNQRAIWWNFHYLIFIFISATKCLYISMHLLSGLYRTLEILKAELSGIWHRNFHRPSSWWNRKRSIVSCPLYKTFVQIDLLAKISITENLIGQIYHIVIICRSNVLILEMSHIIKKTSGWDKWKLLRGSTGNIEQGSANKVEDIANSDKTIT